MEKDFKAIIDRIVRKHQEKLTNWEVEFIASVYNSHILQEKELSEKQKATILEINGKVLGRPSTYQFVESEEN